MVLFLSLLLILPLAGFVATLAAGATLRRARTIALAFSFADTVVAGALLVAFLGTWLDPLLGPRAPYGTPAGTFPVYFVERYAWVPPLGMNVILGVDGLSVPLIFLTPLLTTLAIVFSFKKEERPRQFFALLLLLEFSISGVFLSLDFFLFFVFWELVLIPMFFLIGIWGGPNRQYASIKFLIYTHVGSVIMVGLLLKMGGYGVFRIGLGMLPAAAKDLWWLLAAFGGVSMVYASYVCLAQTDLKRLVAYSSVGHMGFVLLGASSLVPLGIAGGIFQLFAHGLITAVLFMLAGTIKHAAGTREIPALTGLGKAMPQFSFVLIVAFLASLGLPGLVSFWAEFLVFTGFYGGLGAAPWRALVVIPMLSIAVTAAYYIWTLHKVVMGDPNPALKGLHDLNDQERLSYSVLLGLIVFVGLFPLPILGMTFEYATHLASILGGVCVVLDFPILSVLLL